MPTIMRFVICCIGIVLFTATAYVIKTVLKLCDIDN